jgi:hypothetical protein
LVSAGPGRAGAFINKTIGDRRSRHRSQIYFGVSFSPADAETGRALARLPHEDPVLVAGAEIDIDAPYLLAFEYKELRVAEAFAVFRKASVGYESAVALDKNALEIVLLDPVAAIAPTTLEISLFIDPIVKWAGKSKIFGEGGFDRTAVASAVSSE